MINVVNKTIQNTIYCPKNLTETEVNFVFDIHSEITNKSFVFDVIDQSSGSSYYKFDVLFDEVPDGEYNWYVLLSGETRSEGLIRIGNWNPASNGTAYHLIQYDAAGYSPIDLQTKQVEINSEGLTTVEPDNGFVGLKEVQVYVDVPNEYEEGFEDGEAAQKAKLIATAITENGTYTREDGYNQVDVDVDTTPYYESGYTAGYEAGYESGSTEGSEEGYESGYTAGVEAGEAQQKAKLITTAITENGTYAREDGFSSVSVDVPTVVNNQNKTVEYTENGTYIVVPAAGYSGLGSVTINTNVPHTGHTDAEMEQAYQSGYTSGETVGYESGYTSGETVGYASGKTDGVAEQKAKLVTTAVTENGTYSRADGYSSVTVNVPQTGSTINNQNKTVPITTNGTTAVTFDAGYTGLGTVTINTNVPTGSTINNQDKTVPITTNGTTAITFDSQYTGLGTVTINTDVDVNNQDKAVSYTVNGTYSVTPDAGYNGLGTVTVNVATSGAVPESRVSVTLMNAGLIGQAGFNFTYDGGSTAYTFTEATVTIGGLLPGMMFIISYNAVGGYETPEAYAGITYYDSVHSTTVGYIQSGGYIDEYMTIELVSADTRYDTNIKVEHLTSSADLWYSLNDGQWIQMFSTTTISGLTAGDRIRFKGVNSEPIFGYSYGFQLYGSNISWEWKTYGNVMSLVAGDDFRNVFTIPGESVLRNLFYGCTTLKDASNLVLPALELSKDCYSSMFNGCTSLTAGPQTLPATTLANGCYKSMFNGCRSLTSTVSVLPATGLERNCYVNMYAGCTALVHAPTISATSETTSLTGAMYRMFSACANINYIKCLLENPAENITTDWVNGVASTGTFVKNPNATWGTGTSGIPAGWTVQDAS